MVHNQNGHGSGSSPGSLATLSYHGAGLAGGLPALQLESSDGPHLGGAAASRAHVNHQTLPRLEAEAPRSGLSAPQPLTFPLTSAP